MSSVPEVSRPPAHRPAPQARSSRGVVRGVRAAAGVVALLVAGAILWALLSGSEDRARSYGTALAPAAFEAETGVRILHAGLTGGSGILDVRYLVLDPDKALALHDEYNPPALIEQSTGRVFGRSYHSHGGARSLRAGGTYFFLVLNEQHALDHGATVAVKVGDFLLENVKVE